MKRKILLLPAVLAGPALGGCALQAAMLAAEALPAVRGPMGPKNAHLKPQAIKACTARAAQHGSVYIVDVEQRRADRIIVWGSITDTQQRRRTFECHFTTRLSAFKLGEFLAAS